MTTSHPKRMALYFGLALVAAPASAGTLLYQPVNPNFGGNPLNGP